MRPKNIIRTLRYVTVLGLMGLLRILPRDLALIFGAGLGATLGALAERSRFCAERNLAIANHGALSRRRLEGITRRMFVNMGVFGADVARMRHTYKSELADLIDVCGREHFERAYNKGKGVIAVTGHIGNFELMAAWFGQNGYKTAAIGRELYDPRLDALIVENREALRVRNIATTQVKKLVSLLRDGYAVGVLIDFDSHRVQSDLVPSGGRLANTPVGQTILGLRVGSAFVPIACHKVGVRYRLTFHPELSPRSFGHTPADKRLTIVDLTWRARQILDAEIARYPSQWPWSHNRWHNRAYLRDGKPAGLELYERSRGNAPHASVTPLYPDASHAEIA